MLLAFVLLQCKGEEIVVGVKLIRRPRSGLDAITNRTLLEDNVNATVIRRCRSRSQTYFVIISVSR